MFGHKYDDEVRLPTHVQTVPSATSEALAKRQQEALEKVRGSSPLHIPIRKVSHNW